eukprot:jgi/Botrbrau1/21697/Bobra.43_1s0093.1
MAEWQAHVLANIPFYSLLMPAFLDLTLSRVSSRGDSALADLLKVLMVFRTAPELCDLIRTVELEYGRYIAAPGRRPEGRYAELLPFLADQAQEWSAAAAADSANVSPALPGLPELTMFFGGPQRRGSQGGGDTAEGGGGGARGDAGGRTGLRPRVPPLGPHPGSWARLLAAIPPQSGCLWGTEDGPMADLRVKGDPMLVPLSDWEWHWLARVAIHVSMWANRRLELGRAPLTSDPPPRNPLQMATEYCRRHGLRVNLRGIAGQAERRGVCAHCLHHLDDVEDPCRFVVAAEPALGGRGSLGIAATSTSTSTITQSTTTDTISTAQKQRDIDTDHRYVFATFQRVLKPWRGNLRAKGNIIFFYLPRPSRIKL